MEEVLNEMYPVQMESYFQDLKENIIDLQTVTVEDGEKTSTELLLEILEVLTPDEAEQLQVLETTEEQVLLLSTLVEKLDLLNTTLQENQVETIEVLERGNELGVEGSHFMGLALIIGLAVYMFWNQLSKW